MIRYRTTRAMPHPLHVGLLLPEHTEVTVEFDHNQGYQITPVIESMWASVNDFEPVPHPHVDLCQECGCPMRYCMDACHRACDPSITEEEGPR